MPIQLLAFIVPLVLKLFKYSAKKAGWNPEREVMLMAAPLVGAVIAHFAGVPINEFLTSLPSAELAAEGATYGMVGTFVHQATKTRSADVISSVVSGIVNKKSSYFKKRVKK